MRILMELSPSETTAQIEAEEALFREVLKGKEVPNLRAFLEANPRQIIETEAGQASLSYNPVTGCMRVEGLVWPSQLLPIYQVMTEKAGVIAKLINELGNIAERLENFATVLGYMPSVKRILFGNKACKLFKELKPLADACDKFAKAFVTPRKATAGEDQYVA